MILEAAEAAGNGLAEKLRAAMSKIDNFTIR